MHWATLDLPIDRPLVFLHRFAVPAEVVLTSAVITTRRERREARQDSDLRNAHRSVDADTSIALFSLGLRMSELFTGELDAYELTVAANVVSERSDSTIISAIVENGTGAEGGEVDLCISGLASSAYGLRACVTAFELFLNSTLRPEFRLGAALAMAEHGPFTVVTSPEAGPRVIAPAMSVPEDLAA